MRTALGSKTCPLRLDDQAKPGSAGQAVPRAASFLIPFEADQMYHCVAAVDEVTEHLREWAMGEFEIILFDRKNFESQKGLFAPCDDG